MSSTTTTPSTHAPPPPPPPPPPLHPQTSLVNVKSSDLKTVSTNNVFVHFNSCQWAAHYPELREACTKNNLFLEKEPFKYKYKYIESVLQVGPTCGLVALSMLVDSKVTANEMLNVAKLSGYTGNGEMCSCKNMAKLVKEVFNLAGINNVTFELKIGNLFSSETIELLTDGAIILVPYDADCNHSPCLRNGHTAHWALICGILIENPTESFELDANNIYVLCKHGKSKYLAIWKLADLDSSNKNLKEFSPKKGTDGSTYVLPDGGIGGEDGLCNQYLVFKGLNPN